MKFSSFGLKGKSAVDTKRIKKRLWAEKSAIHDHASPLNPNQPQMRFPNPILPREFGIALRQIALDLHHRSTLLRMNSQLPNKPKPNWCGNLWISSSKQSSQKGAHKSSQSAPTFHPEKCHVTPTQAHGGKHFDCIYFHLDRELFIKFECLFISTIFTHTQSEH